LLVPEAESKQEKYAFVFRWLKTTEPQYQPTRIPTKYFCGLVLFPSAVFVPEF
jgi:hypothetical protein